MKYYLFIFLAMVSLSIMSHDAWAQSTVLGCDENVLKKNRAIIDAGISISDELVNATIQQPTPAELMTCTDQRTEQINVAGSLHAVLGGDLSESLGPFVQGPLMNDINDMMTSVSSEINAVSNLVSSTFNDVADDFASALGVDLSSVGLGSSSGPSAPTLDCNVTQQTWLASQCLDLPEVPDLASVLQGKFAEISGEIGDLVDPERFAERMCSAANSALQGYFGDLNSQFDSAVNEITNPITDGIDNINITP